MKKYMIKSVLFALILALAVVRPANAAYLDPNTGGMLFQILAVMFGVFSGLVLFFAGRIRMALYRGMRFLRRSMGKEEETEKISE